jgi:hypothetical protein
MMLAFAALTTTAIVAQPAEIEPNPAAEDFVRAQFAKGEPADLASRFADENERGLSSDFLYDLIGSPGKDGPRRGLELANAIFPEGVVLDHGEIPFDMKLVGCRFLDEVEFSRSHFKGNLVIQRSEFASYLNLIRTEIDGDLDFSGCHLNDTDAEADMTDLQVGGQLDLHDAVFAGRVLFIHSQIGGNLDARRAHFKYFHQPNPGSDIDDSVSFDSVNVGGYALFEDAEFLGSSTFAYANFTRNLGMERARFGYSGDPNKAHLIFSNMKVGNHAFFHQTIFDGTPDFADTEVKGNFQADAAQFNATYTLASLLNLKTGSAEFYGTKFRGGYLIDGFDYRDLTADDPIDLLNHAQFSQDAYGKLESMFVRQGHEGAANQVYIAQKWREREYLSPPAKIGNVLLYVLVGYGRRPWLAFVWGAVFVTIGCFVFRRREMEPQKPEYATRQYSAFWYSLDQFLPFVDLQSAGVWQPRQNSRWARHYVPVHTLLGWILIPIGLAAVSGLIK